MSSALIRLFMDSVSRGMRPFSGGQGQPALVGLQRWTGRGIVAVAGGFKLSLSG